MTIREDLRELADNPVSYGHGAALPREVFAVTASRGDNPVSGQEARSPGLAQCRKAAYDLDTCPNGPDEYGDWPCDPKVLLGGGYAECQVCGRVAAWGRETTEVWARG